MNDWAEDGFLNFILEKLTKRSTAQSVQMPLLLFFTGSDWCGWCIRLQREVFSYPEFKNWVWLNPKYLPEKAIFFKKDVYEKINKIFIPILNNFNAAHT